MTGRKHILLASESSRCSSGDLFPVLESLLPVRFSGKTDVRETTGGHLLVGQEPISNVPGLSTLRVPEFRQEGAAERIEIKVRFADDAKVPFPFRGRSVRTIVSAQPASLSIEAHDTVLADSNFGPIWAVAEAQDGCHFRSGLMVPAISTGANFCDIFNGNCFLEALPLVHWLRHLTGTGGYQQPPLRASFIFDDPNLHWPSYGFVNFREIARRAVKENYHVSFATIPLDAWYTQQRTAAIFRNHSGQLSLCVHGNNHTKRELAQPYDPSARSALLHQAIRRIERLEASSGLKVCRVMVPPHGACSEEMLAALPSGGFEGACISHGSLRSHNRGREWTKTLGYFPSEVIRGCPVLPRWAITSEASNVMLVAAFLGQPLIFRGHHQDLKGGVEVLGTIARQINGLGPVVWSNLTDLSRLNYDWKLDSDALSINPRGCRIRCAVPKQVTRIRIETGARVAGERWRIDGIDGSSAVALVGQFGRLPARINGSVLVQPDGLDPKVQVAPAGFAIVPFLRRILTEGRDRLLRG